MRRPSRLGFAAAGLAVCLVVVGLGGQARSVSEDAAQSCGLHRDFIGSVSERDVDPGAVNLVWDASFEEATFSSPQLVDLNGDGSLDVVQGFGQDTFGTQQSSVIATDGLTGAELWRSTGHEDLIGSATFAHLGGDGTVDVVIGGRRGVLLGIDGADGGLLWSFDNAGARWFNFYTAQVISDQDDDGVVDLVAANGGLIFNEPEEGGGLLDANKRNLGYVFVISGRDGSVISSTPVPDRGESYMSPVLTGSGNERDVLIGTGGETLPGSVWRVPLRSLREGRTGSATVVAHGGTKGAIAPPSLAMMNDDCVLDIVVQLFDGTITVIDGATNDPMWTLPNPGFETYSAPTLGYFVGDDQVPDVFVGIASGVWPDYESSDYLVIDGASAEITWRETLGTFAPSGFAAVDMNGDGRDEVIFGVNDVGADTHELFVLDTSRNEKHRLGPLLGQTTFAAPWVGDIDADGQLDLIVTESSYQSGGAAIVRRYSLPNAVPGAISWGGYLGTEQTGVLAG